MDIPYIEAVDPIRVFQVLGPNPQRLFAFFGSLPPAAFGLIDRRKDVGNDEDLDHIQGFPAPYHPYSDQRLLFQEPEGDISDLLAKEYIGTAPPFDETFGLALRGGGIQEVGVAYVPFRLHDEEGRFAEYFEGGDLEKLRTEAPNFHLLDFPHVRFVKSIILGQVFVQYVQQPEGRFLSHCLETKPLLRVGISSTHWSLPLAQQVYDAFEELRAA